MLDLLLRAKHWQLFLLICAVPITAQLFFMSNMIPPSGSAPYQSQSNDDFTIYMVITTFCALLYFMWLWSVATGLQAVIPEAFRLKVNRFKIALIFPLIGILLMAALFLSPGRVSGAMAAVAIVLNFVAVLCILYAMYFVAKTLSRAESQRKTGFGDFIGEFILVWIFPIGVWILQPKINKAISKSAL